MTESFTVSLFLFAANTVPSISSSPHYPSNLGESQLRSSSAPIPVRPQRMYHPLNKGNVNVIHAVPGAFNFGVSPYQSPLDSPLPSPISSPFTSPSMSPQVSPRPSPAQSPMFRRKSTGSMSGRKEHYQYATVFDWLKSLRLHKYNDIFKDYSFEQVMNPVSNNFTTLSNCFLTNHFFGFRILLIQHEKDGFSTRNGKF